MKKTPDMNPESQDIAELQAMVKALMSEKNELKKKEAQWQQERQSLIEQFKLALDRQFAKRSEALKPYNEAQGDLFNEAECEAAKAEDEVITTTTTTIKRRGKRQPLPKDLPREIIELDLDEHNKQCSCCQHALHKIGEDRSEKLEFTPAVLKVLEYVRPKYACRQCEQQKIASVLTAADKEIELLQAKLAHLKDEKKALMQQLLTGKRRVKVDENVAA